MNKLASLLVLVGLGVVTALFLTGCAAREAVHPLFSYVAPDFGSRGVKTIALMPLVDRGETQKASSIVLPLLEAQALQKSAYIFLSQEEVVGRAMSTGSKEQYDRLVLNWRKQSELGKENVVSLGKGAAAEAFLFGEVFRWSKEQIAGNVEGASQTQVGIKLMLISTTTGEKIWEASDEQMLKSAFYSPISGIGTHVDEAGMVRQSSGASVPEPPPFEEVARRVLDAIFRVFP
ncbi:MAG: hypothetical protein NTX17_02905 [Candidatus Eisenbacteria bacterium]|nr:hypothetical protein [Candidatus Eisenbacteria bacterium]